ncbi:hypothetical protein PFISCL1PPCAC_17900, partial [Pristionchus fissidentatus]
DEQNMSCNDKFEKIFEEIMWKNVQDYQAGDAAAATAMYDAQGVVIDKLKEITKMAQSYIDMGKMDFK